MVPEGPSHPHCSTSPEAPVLEAKERVQGSKAGSTISGLVLNSSSSFASGAWGSTQTSFISGFSCHSSWVP